MEIRIKVMLGEIFVGNEEGGGCTFCGNLTL